MGVFFSIPLPVLQTREFERHGHSTSITTKTHNSILFTCGMHAGLLGLGWEVGGRSFGEFEDYTTLENLSCSWSPS